MRVTIASEAYFPQVNGVSRTLDQLTRYLLACGDDVQLLVPRFGYAQAEAIPRVQRLEFASFTVPFYKDIAIPLTTCRRIMRCLQEYAPDVVHIATEGTLGRATLAAVRKLRIPFVTSYHTNFSQYTEAYSVGFLEALLWRYLRGFHNAGLATFCPTRSIVSLLDQKGFKRLVVWSRGVDCGRFSPSKRDEQLRRDYGVGSGDVLMLYAGRLANEKNLPLLIDAYARVSSTPKSFLMLLGDGPLRPQLERVGGPRLIFAGCRQGEDLARHYAAADAFLFPSVTETFGNVVLEAMASGLPVVAFDAPGPRDIIQDEVTGLLVPTAAPQSLADAASRLLMNAGRRKEMGLRAREYALTQTWPAINKVVRDVYERHANTKARPVVSGQ